MSIKRNLGYLASALLLLVLFSACAQDAMTEAEIKALVQAEVVELQLELFCQQLTTDALQSKQRTVEIYISPVRANYERLAGCSVWNERDYSIRKKGEKSQDIRTDLLCEHRITKFNLSAYVREAEVLVKRICVEKPGGGYRSEYDSPDTLYATTIGRTSSAASSAAVPDATSPTSEAAIASLAFCSVKTIFEHPLYSSTRSRSCVKTAPLATGRTN